LYAVQTIQLHISCYIGVQPLEKKATLQHLALIGIVRNQTANSLKIQREISKTWLLRLKPIC